MNFSQRHDGLTAKVLMVALTCAFQIFNVKVASSQKKEINDTNSIDHTICEFVDVDSEAVPLTSIENLIVYPEEAIRHHIEGKVRIQALISKKGIVEKAVIITSDADIFNQPAIEAITNTKFRPAMSGGYPLRIWIAQTINFKLPK
jgi:TonB family protein